MCFSDRRSLLVSINDEVSTACSSAAAAKAVIGYTDHLKTLQSLENITETKCTTGISLAPNNNNNNKKYVLWNMVSAP